MCDISHQRRSATGQPHRLAPMAKHCIWNMNECPHHTPGLVACNQSAHTMSYIHTYIPVHTYIHTGTYIRTYIRTYVCTYVLTYVRTYARTYVHTYVRTYIHAYITAATAWAWLEWKCESDRLRLIGLSEPVKPVQELVTPTQAPVKPVQEAVKPMQEPMNARTIETND